MSTWVWVFAIAAGLLILVQRRMLKRRHRSLAGGVTAASEACHKECIELLRKALASGEEKAMRQAMNKTTQRTLRFMPVDRSYPETELENECSTLWHRAATIVYGELPTES